MLEFCKKIEKKMELCVINEFIPCYPFYQLHVHLSRRRGLARAIFLPTRFRHNGAYPMRINFTTKICKVKVQ